MLLCGYAVMLLCVYDEVCDIGSVAECEDCAFGAGYGTLAEKPAACEEHYGGCRQCQQIHVAYGAECEGVYRGAGSEHKENVEYV